MIKKKRFIESHSKEVEEALSVARMLKKRNDIFDDPGIAGIFNKVLLDNHDDLKKMVGTKKDIEVLLTDEEKKVLMESKASDT